MGARLGAREVLLKEVCGGSKAWGPRVEAATRTQWEARDFLSNTIDRLIALPSRRLNIASFMKSSEIQASARDAFAWHQSPDALKKLIPPWERVTVEQVPASLADGAVAVLVLHVGPFKLRWVARHRDFIDRGEQGGEFTDEQISGPFASWVHRHVLRATGPACCVLEDRIEYAVPLGWLGETLAGWHVRKKLARMFDYRHAATMSALRPGGISHDQ